MFMFHSCANNNCPLSVRKSLRSVTLLNCCLNTLVEVAVYVTPNSAVCMTYFTSVYHNLLNLKGMLCFVHGDNLSLARHEHKVVTAH